LKEERELRRASRSGGPALLLLLAAVLAAAGTGTARRETLTVFAASSLTEALREIGPAFEKANPGSAVAFSFAASSLLRTQIEQGAPADLFASADGEQMVPLVRAGLVQSPVAFARNRLVIVVPSANPGQIRNPRDLARPGLRLVMTAEQVPIGRYTRAAITRMSAGDAYGGEFRAAVMRNVVSQEPNVRGLLAKIELAEADAAIVYASDARAGGSKVKAIIIPTEYNEIAVYPAAVVARSPRAALAARFFAFLRSGAGQAILKRHGFQPA
jgi:molybdate transport system substrate-binding protein